MTFLIQISFDRNEPVRYLSETGQFLPISSAQVFTNEDYANITAEYLSKTRPELIVKVVPQSEL